MILNNIAGSEIIFHYHLKNNKFWFSFLNDFSYELYENIYRNSNLYIHDNIIFNDYLYKFEKLIYMI